MKKLAAVRYLTLLRDFKLAPMIKTYISAIYLILSSSFKDQRALHMLAW